MATQADSDYKERVRQATDLVRLVGEYVSLRKSGRRWSGLCPFHTEKTPSFSVDEVQQFFFCFGCQTGGDAFKFVMLLERIEFPEALRMLGERAGIEPPRHSGGGGPGRSERDDLYEIHAKAAEVFREFFADPRIGKPARAYAASRGLDAATIERLGIGFAPDSWDALKTRLKSCGFAPAALAASGLFSPRDDGSGYYDRFRSRLVFPIVGVSGRVVGFGGRALGDGEPKYLNSPETPIYTKGEALYGLHVTRDAIRKADAAVVVEGYLDFASLLQAGVENCVATLGTAFTPAQAKLLGRHARTVTMNYDPDTAGVNAAKRSLDVLLPLGLTVRVARLEGELDPDAFVRQRGAAAYREALEAAPGGVEFLIAEAARGRNLDVPSEQGAALDDVLAHIVKIENAAERAAWAGRVAEGLGIEDAVVLEALRKALRTGRPALAAAAPGGAVNRTGRDSGTAAAAAPAAFAEAEARLVRCLIHSAEARVAIAGALEDDDLRGLPTGPILQVLCTLAEIPEPVPLQDLMTRIADEPCRQMLTAIAFRPGEIGSSDEAHTCLAALRRDRMRAERKKVQKEIEAAGASVPEALLRRKMELSRRINELS